MTPSRAEPSRAEPSRGVTGRGARHGVSEVWTVARVAALRVHWDSPLSIASIARAMGLTKGCVIGKVRRLRLATRPCPIIRSNARVPGSPVRRSATLAAASPIETAVAVAAAPEPAVPSETVRAETVFRSLRPVPCCWQFERAGRPRYVSCDAPSRPGSSYCPAHHARAFARRDAGAGAAPGQLPPPLPGTSARAADSGWHR